MRIKRVTIVTFWGFCRGDFQFALARPAIWLKGKSINLKVYLKYVTFVTFLDKSD